MDYVLLAAWCFLVALAGGLVGLVLGDIRLPAVLLLSSSPAAGAGANIAADARLGAPGRQTPASAVGTNVTLSDRELLRAVGVVLLVAAAGMIVSALT
jgi:ABC-type antimicrobial peptide transport system permease subunit